jgi:FKBP-type peptidyl-prolyl cis-trans isomerase
MKQGVLIIIFVVLGAVIIAGGAWYVNSGALTNNSGATNSQATAAPSADAAQAAGTQTANTQQTNSSTTKPMDTNLKIVDTTVGTGTVAANGDTVTVNYIGKLDDGSTFDSSFSRNQPFSFVLGVQQVIKGWDLGVLGMKVGGTRELTIPSDLGYGASGHPPVIPPNATLHFTVTLLAVTSTPAGQ